MKKIKKILLAFAPLAAITIATPIVLTACSDTSNVTPPDGGDTTTNPSFQKDLTNSADFKLEENSKAQEILNKYKTAIDKTAADNILKTDLASFPKKDSATLAKDVLNMWSNNNWITITNNAKDEKVKTTFISNLDIKKAEVDANTGKATFDVEYKNAFTDSKNRKFEAIQVLKGTNIVVDTSTKIDVNKSTSKYLIDGKEQSLDTTISLLGDDFVKTNFETVLKQPTVSLDAKEVFDTFISNHGIVVEGTWSDSVKEIQSVAAVKPNKAQIDVLLDSFKNTNDDWYGLKRTSKEADIKAAIYTTTDGVNNLNETFKNLINDKDSFKEITVNTPTASKNVLAFVITLKKDDNSTKALKLNIKFV